MNVNDLSPAEKFTLEMQLNTKFQESTKNFAAMIKSVFKDIPDAHNKKQMIVGTINNAINSKVNAGKDKSWLEEWQTLLTLLEGLEKLFLHHTFDSNLKNHYFDRLSIAASKYMGNAQLRSKKKEKNFFVLLNEINHLHQDIINGVISKEGGEKMIQHFKNFNKRSPQKTS